MLFLSIIRDEICAAGLDGIPVSHLWDILQEPQVHFPLAIDDSTKEFLWDRIRMFKFFEFFVRLEEPTPYLYFDRFQSLAGDDTEYYYTSESSKSRKRLCAVDDSSVYGSCADFRTRKNVTVTIKSKGLAFQEAYAKWGNKLVVVASQRLRTFFLTGSETLHSSINAKLYRILELIGKSRYNGIPISGPNGILAYGESSSTIFYVRKLFCGDGLIKSQPFISRESPSRSLRHTTLLHSFRFFKPLPYPLALIMEKVSNLLSEAPSKMMLPYSIRQKCSMGRRAFMRLLKFGVHQGSLKVIHVPFGTACALVCGTDGDSGEISAELLRQEAAELSCLASSQPSVMPEHAGRRFIREAAVVYLQCPFDLDQYMKEAHVNRGSRPDSLWNLTDNQNDSSVLDDAVQIIRDVDEVGGGLIAPEDEETFACAPYYAPNLNGEESFCVQICRLLCEADEKPNSQLASIFNTSHKLISRYTDALAGLGKLLTSKVSTGTSFSLVRRYMTEAEVIEFQEKNRTSKQTGIVSVYNQRQLRKTFILKTLEEVRVFPSVVELRARIWAQEEAQGSKVKMDRKSLARIINELVKEKKLKFISMQIDSGRSGDTARIIDLKMICHPSIDTDSPELINCVLAEKMRQVEVPCCYSGVIRPEDALNDALSTEMGDLTNSVPAARHQDIQAINKKELQLIRLPDKNVSRLRRRCLLHKFLFYLLYEHPGSAEGAPSASSETWAPPVYNEQSVTYRYVPPIPKRGNIPAGWITFHDLVQCMPLGLFLALAAPGTSPRILLQWLSVLTRGEETLRPVFKTLIAQQCRQAASFSPSRGQLGTSDAVNEDTLRRFELLRTPMLAAPCPGGHRGSLYAWLISRVNVTKIYGLVEQLSGQGLLTLSGQGLHGHVPIANIYVHKQAVLLDTRFSAPSHHIISDISACPPPRTYGFTCTRDLDGYWINMRAILLYTPYGFTRFSDPPIGKFLDPHAPVLLVDRLQDVVSDKDRPPSLPPIQPTRLKEAVADELEQFTLLGVGGFHASLYPVQTPFEEIGYGTTLQGICTKYEPPYPSPSLQLQPVIREKEMAVLVDGGTFEPGLRTIGDGAFWPWTVQLFFDAAAVIPLPPPPTLPAILFSCRARRYPFVIESPDNGSTAAQLRSGWRRKVLRKRRSQRFHGRQGTASSASSQSSTSSDSSRSSRSASKVTSAGEDDEERTAAAADVSGDAGEDSSFGDLQDFLQSRKKRMQKRTTIPHIHRKAFGRRNIVGDRRALDDRDVEIRNSLHYRRASWCKLEDQLLLACRVASLFLVGHTREYVCIPYVIVRDILHDYLPVESQDKTSLACARRLKFLLMLRNAERTRADILLTEVSSDPELLAKYNIGKVAWVHLYNREAKQAHQFFRDLVQLIVHNFVPDLRGRCGQVASTPRNLPLGQEWTGPEARHFSIREMLLQSREALENQYNFVLLASISNDQVLPDIASSRPAIVAEALRNLFLGSIRLEEESHQPHDSVLFNRILKQYPYEQLSQAVKCLALTDSLRKIKSFEKCDLDVVKQFQMKVTLRLSTWCNIQMFIYVRFFAENYRIHNQLRDEARLLRNRLLHRKDSDLEGTADVDAGATSVSTNSTKMHASQEEVDDWVVVKHNFTEPSSGGLVATFFELLSTPTQTHIKINFDMSSISIMSKPCMSLEDRRAEANSGTAPVQPEDEENDEPLTPKRPRMASSLLFGESTHIGMTVALLEGSSAPPTTTRSAGAAGGDGATPGRGNAIAESLMALLLEGGCAGDGDGVKGKTPRIDIRLSLNGGSIEALAPGTAPYVTVVDGESEHRRLCRRVIDKFTSSLTWDAAAAKALSAKKGDDDDDEFLPTTAFYPTRLHSSRALKKAPTEPAGQRAKSPRTRLDKFVFDAGDLGRTFDQIKDQFGDTTSTGGLLHGLLDDQKIFLLGLSEPRYVHWAHLRLWLVHVKEPKRSGKARTTTVLATTEIGTEVKRRRLTLAVSEHDVAILDRRKREETANKAADPAADTSTDDSNDAATDYYFVPQPWITERGRFKTNFFTHLIQSICSMVSRHSGAPMDVLAREHRHLLSPVSFRLLCHFLHNMKVIRISRVCHVAECSLFSRRNPATFLNPEILLAPACELTLSLEALFVSRMQTVFECLCESFGHTPTDPTPFVQFARSRASRQATVLQTT